jgi:hypothetical protein
MKKKLIVLSGLALGFSPLLALAQTPIQKTCGTGPDGTILGIICTIGNILNTIIPFLITLGILYFVWGVVTYVISADEEQKTKGRDKMIYGIIGLAVIVSVWGLVNILVKTFDVGTGSSITIPCIKGTPGC